MILQDKDLDRLTLQYKKLALEIQANYNTLIETVTQDNREKLVQLIEANIHTQLNDLEDNDIYGLGDSIYDDLDTLRYNFYHEIENKSKICGEFMEWIAPYALFDTKWSMFDDVYFSTTENYSKALEYATRMYEYIPSTSLAIYAINNKNEDFFQAIFDIHLNHTPEEFNFRQLKNICPQTVNPNSWIEYYLYYFNSEVTRVMNSRLYQSDKIEENDAINLVFYELFKKYNKSGEVHQFLIEDYHQLIGIKEKDFINLNIALSVKKDSLLKDNIILSYKNSRRPRLSLSPEICDNHIQDLTNHIVSKYSASVCIEKFQQLNLDEKYYTSLKRNIELNILLSHKENTIKAKKI